MKIILFKRSERERPEQKVNRGTLREKQKEERERDASFTQILAWISKYEKEVEFSGFGQTLPS